MNHTIALNDYEAREAHIRKVVCEIGWDDNNRLLNDFLVCTGNHLISREQRVIEGKILVAEMRRRGMDFENCSNDRPLGATVKRCFWDDKCKDDVFVMLECGMSPNIMVCEEENGRAISGTIQPLIAAALECRFNDLVIVLLQDMRTVVEGGLLDALTDSMDPEGVITAMIVERLSDEAL